MHAFTFYSPTQIRFGKDALLHTGELVKKHFGSRVLMVYGSGSAVKSGLIGMVSAQLENAGLASLAFGGARPNPTLSHVREGVRAALDFGADFILAIGGGSAIDSAKAIAHGAANPQTDVWRFWSREVLLAKSMPVGVVLTISAAGSETSASPNRAVILENGEEYKYKRNRDDFVLPGLWKTVN